MKPSRDYRTVTRDGAERHFGERGLRVAEMIQALPLAEKFRLIGDAVRPRIAEMYKSGRMVPLLPGVGETGGEPEKR